MATVCGGVKYNRRRFLQNQPYYIKLFWQLFIAPSWENRSVFPNSSGISKIYTL